MEAILRNVTDPSDLAQIDASQLPYRLSEIFSLEGFGAKRLEKKRLKLMKQIDEQIRPFLIPDEEIDFVTWGMEFSTFETIFMGAWAQLLNRRAIILTNRRILLVQIDSRHRVRELKSHIQYRAIKKFARATFGYLGLIARDKKAHYLMGVPRKDRKRLRERIAARVEAAKTERPIAGRENICPHCGIVVVGYPDQCDRCSKPFKSGAKAGWLSLIFPGFGDFYLGHRALGVMEMLGAAFAWSFVFLISSEGSGERPTDAIVIAVIIALFVHVPDAFVTRHMGMKGIYPAGK